MSCYEKILWIIHLKKNIYSGQADIKQYQICVNVRNTQMTIQYLLKESLDRQFFHQSLKAVWLMSVQ